MKYHENICVFYKKQPIYNKQMIPRDGSRISDAHKSNYIFTNRGSEQSPLAEISVDSKKIHIGIFDTLIEAAKAYDKYVIDNKLEHTINGVI